MCRSEGERGYGVVGDELLQFVGELSVSVYECVNAAPFGHGIGYGLDNLVGIVEVEGMEL